MLQYRRIHKKPIITTCLIILFILISLIACGTSPDTIVLPTPLPTLTPPPKTPQPITSDVQTRWLTSQPCAPPCWEGITPGTTHVAEAISTLNWHPLIRNIAIGRWPGDHEGLIRWDWNGSDRGSGVLGYVQQGEDSIVAWVFIAFSEPFSLTEIRTAYGDPSHVVPYVGYGGLPGGSSGGSDFYEFTVVYLKQGFFLQTEREFYHPPTIDPQMALSSRVVFFPPTLAGLEAVPVSTRGWKSTDLLPWQGFLEFVDYCAQIRPIKDAQQRCPVMKP
jgi:hypothetical protein